MRATFHDAHSKAGVVAVISASVALIAFFGLLVARWQASVATEKLRYDLYDRRFAIYMAFHTLLVAVLEKDDAEAELRAASAAKAHAPFLLDTKLVVYLEELHKEAFRIDIENKQLRIENIWSPAELASRASLLGRDKLAIANKIAELVEEFGRFIRLKDLARSDFFSEIILWGKVLVRWTRNKIFG